MLLRFLQYIRARYASKSSFSAHILTLLTGTTIAQAIPIAIAPILTRLYEPTHFGVFALFAAVVATIGTVATARYELAVVLAKNSDDAANLLALSIFISFAVSFCTLVMVCVFNAPITIMLGNQSISRWLYWVPLAILLTGIYQSLSYWTSRFQKYKILSFSKINQSISMSSANFIFGFSGLNGGLILGNITGQFFATSTLVWQLWRDDKKNIDYVTSNAIKKVAFKYRDFPKLNLIHAFIDALQTNAVIFVVFAFFGNVVLGHFTFSQRILKMPINLIGSSIGQVFYQKASETYRTGGDLHELTKKTMRNLSLFSIPIFGILYFFAPSFFVFLFGEKWEIAGQYAQIMMPLLLLNFITSPISQITLILKRQKAALFIGILYNFSIFIPLIYMFYIDMPFEAGLLYSSIASSVVLFFYSLWLLRISKINRSCDD